MWSKQKVTQGTAGRLLSLLRQKPMTVDELAEAVGVTRSAVRAHLATMMRDGLIVSRGLRRGVSKPSHTYEVTALAEQGFSRAYVPVFRQLLDVLSRRVEPPALESLMRDVGRAMVAGKPAPRGTLRERVFAASALLKELGGQNEIEENGSFVIRGHGCPLGAVTPDHPAVCRAVESLLTEFVGSQVTSRCDQTGHTRCCFEIPRGPEEGGGSH